MTYSLLTTAHLLICAFLILIILLQQGKGADVGATFGGGGNTLFGASGADTLLTKVTAVASFAFMLTSVFLAVGSRQAESSQGALLDALPASTPAAEVITIPEPEKPSDETSEEKSPAAENTDENAGTENIEENATEGVSTDSETSAAAKTEAPKKAAEETAAPAEAAPPTPAAPASAPTTPQTGEAPKEQSPSGESSPTS